MDIYNPYVKALSGQIPPWFKKESFDQMIANPRTILSINHLTPERDKYNASINDRELITVLACCHMVAEATIDMCLEDELKELKKDASILLSEVIETSKSIRSKIKLSTNNEKALLKANDKLGADWKTSGTSLASMHVFCEAILQTHIERIEDSPKRKERHNALLKLQARFTSMWYLIDSWFPHDSAEADSIRLFEQFNLCMRGL